MMQCCGWPVVAAARVSKRTHALDATPLTVEKLAARPPPPMILKDVDEDELLFTHLPLSQQRTAAAADDDDATNRDDKQKLKAFVESAAGAEISDVTYSAQRDKAVVSFCTTPG